MRKAFLRSLNNASEPKTPFLRREETSRQHISHSVSHCVSSHLDSLLQRSHKQLEEKSRDRGTWAQRHFYPTSLVRVVECLGFLSEYTSRQDIWVGLGGLGHPWWHLPVSPEWRKRAKLTQTSMQTCGLLCVVGWLLHRAANKQNHVFQNSYGVTLRLPCIMYLSLTNSCTVSFTSCSLWLELQLSIETMCLILNTSPPLQINQPFLTF